MGSTGTESAAGVADAEDERRNVSDAAGVLLLAACAAWSLITAAAHGGRPEGILLAVLAVTAGYASGRIFGALLPVAAPAVGALLGVGFAIAAPHAMPGPQPLAPLGHSGAVAALLTLSSGAACCAAWAARGPAPQFALRLSVPGIAGVAAALGSMTGLVASIGVLLYSLTADRTRHRARVLTVFALVATLVTAATWAMAGNVTPGAPSALLEDQLGGHRVLLWRDALTLAREHPALGAGPGLFGELSPVAAQSLLPDGKPHSAPLQQAAEQGLIGLALLTAVFCWFLHALRRTQRPTPIALTAGAALTALAVIASVGDALSFTAVTAGAGMLAGIATARPLWDGEGPGGQHPRNRAESSR
ncbi:O-antigen ligase family protein [Streptomyces glomeratus]|uniref:O-antigen ligase-related domain-containing protein n=1 Tax=Streptomyces glomeratus TaxID=284452 RepID=A0ABP6LP68_9ACTN|nr:O-antigen ligase family protein [Streptomyces glomeratus]MCF1508637.1 O-antigen ligase family protein [Streptomyces glomeratus]